MSDVMNAVVRRIYRRLRDDGTLYPAWSCLALARAECAATFGDPVVDEVDRWSDWEPIPGAEVLARRVMVVDDWSYQDDSEVPDVDEVYADLRRSGLGRHVAAKVAEARLDRWKWEAAEARWVCVRVEVSCMGFRSESSLGGVALQSLSDPYLVEVVKDCTADAVFGLQDRCVTGLR